MRIIAGTKRGVTIGAPKGRDTRPTLDRVKESLFGIIQFDIYGKSVLDLFAGSGNLGLEALSRGAVHAVFNDMGRESVAVIRANIAKLGFEEKSTVYSLNYRAAVQSAARAGYRFGLVFLDPPYKAGLLESTLLLLRDAGVLETSCLIIAEHAHALPPETPEGFTLHDRRKYGEAAISIFKEEPKA
ncbi:MAG: 16S rRNA (guanine(966)-N(2))-methyltransferase RsmD [Clostridia bacterium]|nr:16S rRNA (guanine(966)-N(2))-methyltransferase RsmD [Clostridia bacterium]